MNSHHDSQRETFLICIEKTPSHDAFGEGSHKKLGCTFFFSHSKSVLDCFWIKSNDLFKTQGKILGLEGFPESSLLGQEGKNPIGGYYTICSNLFVLGLDSDNLSSFPDKIVHILLRDNKH